MILRENDEFVTVSVSGSATVPDGARFPVEGSLSHDALSTGCSVLVTDPDDPRFFKPLTDELGVSSLVAVPLFRGDRPVGSILAGTVEGELLAEDDVRAIELLAAVLSSAMSRVAELEAQQERVAERKRAERILEAANERLELIAATQADIAAIGLDVDAAMQLVADRSQAMTGADAVAVLLVDGDSLAVAATSGHAAPALGMRIPLEDSAAASAIATGRSLLVTRPDDVRLYRALADEFEVKSFVAVPLFQGERSIGAIVAMNQVVERPLGEDDLRTLDLLAVVLSSALSRAAEIDAERRQVDTLSRFETIYTGAPIGIGILDLEGQLVETNQQMRDLLGRVAAELASAPVASYTHPDDRKAVSASFARMLAGEGDAYRIEVRALRADGTIVWTDTSVSLVRDSAGEPAFAVAMAQDISEHKRAEESLREQTERLARIVETQSDVAAVGLDLDAVMQLVTERAQMLTEAEGAVVCLLEGDEIVVRSGSGVLEPTIGTRGPKETASVTLEVMRTGRAILVHEKLDKGRVPKAFRVLLEGGSYLSAPLFHGGTAIGSINIATTATGQPLTQTDRQTLELLALMLSSAVSRAAEFEAKQQQLAALARFESVYHGSPVGIGLLSLDDRHWLDVNQAMLDITGRTAEELRTMSPADYTHPDDAGATADEWRRLVAGELESYRIEARYIRKDGSLVWANSSLTLVSSDEAIRASSSSCRRTCRSARRRARARAELRAARADRGDAERDRGGRGRSAVGHATAGGTRARSHGLGQRDGEHLGGRGRRRGRRDGLRPSASRGIGVHATTR